MTKTDVRELILEILLSVTRDGQQSHIALRNILEKYQYLEKQERAFLTRVSEGTLERMIELDFIINQFSKVKVNKMKPVIRCIMRMSVYQLKYMDSVPDSAVVNEAVKLAKKKGFSGLTGFVNGVLRSTARGLSELKLPQGNAPEALSVRYSMPLWMIGKWKKDFGEETMLRILEGFTSEETGTTVRVKGDKEAIIRELEADGIEVKRLPLPDAVQISHYDTLMRIPAFARGDLSVQDVSSMLAVLAADVKGGEKCLDVCAAPGGKALYLAEKLSALPGEGSVLAQDISFEKVSLIDDNIDRSGLDNVDTRVWDATVPDEDLYEQYDVVVADLPCSGLGVLGKKPDIRYQASEEKIKALSELQRQILEVVWHYVKPGGKLIYSTCTITKEENALQAEKFLKDFPFERGTLPDTFAGYADEEERRSGICQIFPTEEGNDGFFVASFIRK